MNEEAYEGVSYQRRRFEEAVDTDEGNQNDNTIETETETMAVKGITAAKTKAALMIAAAPEIMTLACSTKCRLVKESERRVTTFEDFVWPTSTQEISNLALASRS